MGPVLYHERFQGLMVQRADSLVHFRMEVYLSVTKPGVAQQLLGSWGYVYVNFQISKFAFFVRACSSNLRGSVSAAFKQKCCSFGHREGRKERRGGKV